MVMLGTIIILVGLLILAITITKSVKMMRADNDTKTGKYHNKYDTFTKVSSSEYNDIDKTSKSRYFQGEICGTYMESENPTIIKLFLLGFGTFWAVTGLGVYLIITNFTDVSLIEVITFLLFVVIPSLCVIVKGIRIQR